MVCENVESKILLEKEFCKKKEWVPFYNLNVFFMANLFFLLFLFMFNFVNIGTNMLNKEDWQHQSNNYANACAASISIVLNILQQWLQVTTSDYETPNRLQHRRFPIYFAKFLRILFFTEHLRWLLLAMGAPYLVMLQVTLNFIHQGL